MVRSESLGLDKHTISMNPYEVKELKEVPTLEEYEQFCTELEELLAEPQTQKSKGLYVRLFLDTEQTLEASYENYKAAEISKNPNRWDILKEAAFNKQPIAFPQCSGNNSRPQTIVSFAISRERTGKNIFGGKLTRPLLVFERVTPMFERHALEIGLDKFKLL